ncbi:MAG: ankyrin repeat domain-containing protein [Clostridia bacterium]|nr:ankyrin repeat domain-containing protein [Clostridia bacterium]
MNIVKNLIVLLTSAAMMFGCGSASSYEAQYSAEDLPSIKMYYAALNDNVPLAEEAIRYGEDINTFTSEKVCGSGVRFEKETSILFTALGHGAYDVFQLLVEKGADMNIISADGFTVLEFVGYMGELQRFAIEHGADLNLENDDGERFVEMAFGSDWQYSEEYILQNLDFWLENGGKVEKRELDALAQRSLPPYRLIERLCEISPEAREKYAKFAAAKSGDASDIDDETYCYLAAMGDVSKIKIPIGDVRNNALCSAVRYGNFENAVFLYNAGASVTFRVAGYNAVDYAIICNRHDILKYFIAEGLTPEANQKQEQVTEADLETIELLLESFPTLYDAEDLRWAVLDAMKEKDHARFELLLNEILERGGDLSGINNYNDLETVKIMEKCAGEEVVSNDKYIFSQIINFFGEDKREAMEYLIGKYPEFIQTAGGSGLEDAIELGDFETVRFLVESGAPIGENIVHAARSTDEIFEYLIENGADVTVSFSNGINAVDILNECHDEYKLSLIEKN